MMQEGIKIVVIRFMFILLVFYVELSYAQQNSPQARDQQLTPFCWEDFVAGHFENNIQMIKYWTPKFEKLNASIPSLSPKEEEWLKNELKSNDASRRFRVNNSTENYLRDVKRWTSMLQYLISNSETSTDKLSFLAYELSDRFMSDKISVLIERKVLDKNALPSEWTLFGLSTQALDRTRMHLVSFLSSCTIPNTLSNKPR